MSKLIKIKVRKLISHLAINSVSLHSKFSKIYTYKTQDIYRFVDRASCNEPW